MIMRKKLYAVIDVGSNSVRMMLSDGVKTAEKFVRITGLAVGMGATRMLDKAAIARTADAVAFFVNDAGRRGAEDIFVFATAAARRADNAEELTGAVKKLCGADIDIISGEQEARIGYIGALSGGDGGVIDVGGASTEIVCVKGEPRYLRSFDIGSVNLTERSGDKFASAFRIAKETFSDCSPPVKTDYYAVGGTATSAAAMLLRLDKYDRNAVHGFKIRVEELRELCEKLFSMSVEERAKCKGLQPERAGVIACGTAVLLTVADRLGLDGVTVSENDNLEGYLTEKLKNE